MASPATSQIGRRRARLKRSLLRHPFFGRIPKLTGELWTARQRQMHSLHYIVSYRASFKPELPAWFIERLSRPGEIVLDPFAGRGTTALQANLMGRVAWSADVNPLSERIITPKTNPVAIDEIERALARVDWRRPSGNGIDLSMFYHPQTELQIRALRGHLAENRSPAERFLELVALSRLHGHSPGFFSVYSFPQISIPPDAQRRINAERAQKPGYRSVPDLILRKTRRALRDGRVAEIAGIGRSNRTVVADARALEQFPDGSVDLVVTSPPFLNKADYITDNWLEFWFCGIEPEPLRADLLITPDLRVWRRFITDCFRELHRLLKPGRRAVVEVGEVVIGGTLVRLEEELIDIAAGLCREGIRLVPETVYIHSQRFTKLANCFKVDNNVKGTNTNRLVVFLRE